MQTEIDQEMDAVDVLNSATRNLTRVDDLESGVSALAWWAGAIVGARTDLSVYLLDDRGRLNDLSGATSSSTRSTARRRQVLSRGTPEIVDVGSKRSKALFPLLGRGDRSIGVMEVTAPSTALRPRLAHLEVLANQMASIAGLFGMERRWRSRMTSITRLLDLRPVLAGCTTPEEVLGSSIRYVGNILDASVAGWIADDPGADSAWRFVGSKGIGVRRQGLLADGVLRRNEIPARFTAVTGHTEVSVVDSTRAVLVLAVPDDEAHIVGPLASMIDEGIQNVEAEQQISVRARQLDLGLAVTAHEIRGPLLGAGAALDSIRSSGVWTDTDRDLLRRTRKELGELAGRADGLLRWASTSGPSRGRALDLLPVVRSAVAACGRDVARVHVNAIGTFRVRASARQLRSAVTNLIRNALAYSPPDGDVRVSVSSADGWVTVDIEDEGPGVPQEMQTSIFDPFARGPAIGNPEGAGLGLFIARRVVEAHGGSLRLMEGSPTTFRIRLPAASEGRKRPSAS